MIIVNVASEINPYAKTGGLADVVGSMPFELSGKNEIFLFMPLYPVTENRFSPELFGSFSLFFGYEKKTVVIKRLVPAKNVTIFFVCEYNYFERDKIYGDYHDDAERFAFFSKAVLEFLKIQDIRPDIIHCHDWQTGVLPLFVKEDDYFRNTVTGFTIHNIAYQGNFPYEKLSVCGIDNSYFSFDKMEFYGNISFLKSGIIFSDFVNTVSPSYRDETLTSEFGFGMQDVLEYRKDDYYGVINGIDYKEWNPEKDKYIVKSYSYKDVSGKSENRQALIKECFGANAHTDRPVFCAVTRLAFQKGIEFISDIIPELAARDCYVIILGSGEKRYEDLLEKMEDDYTSNFRFIKGYDFELSHRLYAGSDFFLMPSIFEPCGLSQMISLRYGTFPIVRKTGGLKDTVTDMDDNGNGFVFEGLDAESFRKTLDNAYSFFFSDKIDKKRIDIMKQDWSWKKTARTYMEIYKKYGRKLNA